MVGGDVSIVTARDDGAIEVQVVGRGPERYQRLAVLVEDSEKARRIKAGDRLWWQSSWVFWTPVPVPKDPRDGVDYDIRLNRASYSYEPKPKRAETLGEGKA